LEHVPLRHLDRKAGAELAVLEKLDWQPRPVIRVCVGQGVQVKARGARGGIRWQHRVWVQLLDFELHVYLTFNLNPALSTQPGTSWPAFSARATDCLSTAGGGGS